METNSNFFNKTIFAKIFEEEDYNKFLNIIDGKENEISNIDKSPIQNFEHNITELCSEDELVFLYQHIKYYLESRNLYTPKLQEGIALCASKAIIIDSLCQPRIDSYLNVGDRLKINGRNNPFEEIARVLLIAVKNEHFSNNFGEKTKIQGPIENLQYENIMFLDVISKAMNKEKLDKRISYFSKDNVINDIGSDLELSNITSTSPLSVSKQENREILLNQFERIYNLYDSRIDYRVIFGELPNNSLSYNLLTRFSNKIVYARRNVGVYEKTKQLKKEF